MVLHFQIGENIIHGYLTRPHVPKTQIRQGSEKEARRREAGEDREDLGITGLPVKAEKAEEGTREPWRARERGGIYQSSSGGPSLRY